MREISLDDSIFSLVEKYPESKEILISLGFTHIADARMLNTIARKITLRKAARNHSLSYDTINEAFMQADIIIIEEEI